MQVMERRGQRRPAEVVREYQTRIAEAEAAVERTTRLLAAQQARLVALRASLARVRQMDGEQPVTGLADTNGHRLTPRQLEILRYLSEGLSTTQIAERLWLSTATVRNHVSGILAALRCHSRLEAVAQARRLGLV
jgi:DNA-binding NarL/FixJ family response regulator